MARLLVASMMGGAARGGEPGDARGVAAAALRHQWWRLVRAGAEPLPGARAVRAEASS